MIVVKSNQKKTKEEAAEMIRRLDKFWDRLYSGNNHEFNRTLYKISGFPADYERLKEDHSCCDMDIEYIPGNSFDEKWKTWENWKKEWGCLDLEIMGTEWISSPYIFGPHGWIDPYGNIGGILYEDKYDEPEDVENDLKKIAEAWKDLEMEVYFIWEANEGCIEVGKHWKMENGNVTVLGENFELEDLKYEPGIYEKKNYWDLRKDKEHPECWWSLDELKELFGDKLKN